MHFCMCPELYNFWCGTKIELHCIRAVPGATGHIEEVQSHECNHSRAKNQRQTHRREWPNFLG